MFIHMFYPQAVETRTIAGRTPIDLARPKDSNPNLLIRRARLGRVVVVEVAGQDT